MAVSVRIDGTGDYTATIRGAEMRVESGHAERPSLWFFTTTGAVERFLEDAAGPRRFLPYTPADGSTLVFLSDPRIVKRAALASGRLELALRDDDGERIAVVLGFGHAARRRIDPDEPDASVEVDAATLARILGGTLSPEAALTEGAVKVRGSRMLAMQLALAVAPFYPQTRG
ncbi:MAG TPA: SCP2 sterol-binding domain-containing protein [Polyangiaceae bacterium]|nr:SCP2 sterol-binding domain-containing protein [Polyangiaceae bacterium]